MVLVLTLLGPIIRINPDKIHIDDPDFYDDICSKQGKLDRYDLMPGRFGNDTSMFTRVAHEHYKARRAPIQPLFSRNRILQIQDLIREKNKKMLGKAAQYKQSGRPLTINEAFRALSEDVVLEFCSGQCYDVLDMSDFKKNVAHGFKSLSMMGHLSAHLPWIPKIIVRFPESWLEKLEPQFAIIFRLKYVKSDIRVSKLIRTGSQTMVRLGQRRSRPASTSTKHTTILRAVLDNDILEQEKDSKHLREEAHVILSAAVTTTGWAASVAAFHVISNPQMHKRLRQELVHAVPDPTADLDWVKLEKLPYLTACIQEAIRLSIEESSRSPRIADHAVMYRDYRIPAHTPISLTIPHVVLNEKVFPEPKRYIPERWLDGKIPDKYYVMFGKGSRPCPGIQLAYSEMYHMLAGVFRLFAMELYETNISDVEFCNDYAIPLPKFDSNGIRVIVKADDKVLTHYATFSPQQWLRIKHLSLLTRASE